MYQFELRDLATSAQGWTEAQTGEEARSYGEGVEDALRLAAGDIGGTAVPERLRAIIAFEPPVEDEDEQAVQSFSPAELDYLARSVDLGRSDPQASQILRPDERDTLLRKLGGRRSD